MRGALEAALAGAASCSRPTSRVRAAAVAELPRTPLDESQLPLVEKAFAAETDAGLKAQLERHARDDPGLVVRPAPSASRPPRELGRQQPERGRQALLQERLARRRREPTPRCASRCSRRSSRCAARLAWGERLGVVFTGISLGSILLLVALGLAITYGLMGVINMAHGELMMIGAYTTYVVQNLFRSVPAGRVRLRTCWPRSRRRSWSRRWSARCSSAA